MKQTTETDALKDRLRNESYTAGDNPWFTPTVKHRLPESRRAGRWVAAMLYVLAIAVCAVCWVVAVRNFDVTVVTVRDVVRLGIMVAVSGIVLWQCVSAALSSSES